MSNQYGADLRELIVGSYAVDTVVDDARRRCVRGRRLGLPGDRRASERTPAASGGGRRERPISAQTMPRNSPHWARRVAGRPTLAHADRRRVTGRWLVRRQRPLAVRVSPAQLALVADLESSLPTATKIRRTGTRVSGSASPLAATTCTSPTDADPSRRASGSCPSCRLVTRHTDLPTGRVATSSTRGTGSGLVDLERYPHGSLTTSTTTRNRLRARHIARSQPDQWYRTIDRVHVGLLGSAEARPAGHEGCCPPGPRRRAASTRTTTSTTW